MTQRIIQQFNAQKKSIKGTPMKIVKISIIVFFLVLALAFGLVNTWTRTPHGKLDVKIAILLKYISIRQINLFEQGNSIEQSRSISAKGGKVLQAKPLAIMDIKDRTIPGSAGPIPIRIYSDSKQKKLPIIIYCHGGGWVLGSLDSHDNTCRAIAQKARTIVVAVDYRLAPEAPYPAAIEDIYSALVWTRKNAILFGGDPDKIIMAGDSAGGNLAAVTAIEARWMKTPPIAGQILIYPVTDLSKFNTNSHRDFARGYYLTRQYMEKFRDYYVPSPSDRINPKVSPLLEANLQHLPPTMVVTAQFDILRDEGEAYARRLKEAGVQVKQIRVNGVIHGFLKMDGILPQADDVLMDIASFIREIPQKPSQ